MPKTKLKRKKNFKRTKRQKKYIGGVSNDSLSNDSSSNESSSNETLFSIITSGLQQTGHTLYNKASKVVSDVGKQIALNIENTLLKSLELIQNPKLKLALQNTIDQLGEKEKEKIAEALNSGLITEAKSLTNAVVSAAAEIPGLNIPIEASRIASSGLQAVEGGIETANKLVKITEEVATNLQENLDNINSGSPSELLQKGVDSVESKIPSPSDIIDKKIESVASKIPSPSDIIDKKNESVKEKHNINKLIKQNGGISKRIIDSINQFENPLENKINNPVKSKGKTKRVRFSI